MSDDNTAKTGSDILDVIRRRLQGDAQRNALKLVAFFEENDMTLDPSGDGQGWAVGGIVGNSIGFLLVNGAAQVPGPWTLWLNSCEFGDTGPVDEDIKACVWAHVNPCGKCHPGWIDCGGGGKAIWGKQHERLCHSPLMFTNPGIGAIGHIKKLLLMLQ